MVDRASEGCATPFLEFRLDYRKTARGATQTEAVPCRQFGLTAIATCRRAANGGKFKGTIRPN